MNRDIAIVGLAVHGPGVRDQRDYWDLIVNGRSTSGPFPTQRGADIGEYLRLIREVCLTPDPVPVEYFDGCFMDRIDEFDYGFFGMTPKQASLSDPQQRLVLQTTYEALEDAGYTGARGEDRRVGMFVGFSTTSGYTYLNYLGLIDRALGQIGLMGNLQSMMANRLSHQFDLTGPSVVVDTACSSGIVALHQAKTALLHDECELAVVAGARVVLVPEQHPAMKVGFESPDGMTRVFDERADGTGLGEGSGAVVLKRLDAAIADGDQIYAVVKGSAVNHNGHTENLTHPDARSQARLLDAAWTDGVVDPTGIRYLETHGTATRTGDPVEIEGLRLAFGRYTDKRGFCALGAVKANIGHLLEAAGIAGLIKTALVLRRRTIPPVANLETPNPRIPFDQSPVYLPTSPAALPLEQAPVLAGVSAFGLGGTNAHAVLEEYHPAPGAAQPRPGTPHLFTLSARTESALSALVQAWTEDLRSGRLDDVDLADLCYTTNISRGGHRHRLALVVSSVDELRERLPAFDRQTTASIDATRPADDRRAALAALASSYVDGSDIEARAVAAGAASTDLLGEPLARRPRIVHLVPYQFEAHRCWVDIPETEPRERPAGAVPDTHPVAHDVSFVPVPPPAPAGEPARFLVLADPDGAATAFVSAVLPDARVLTLADEPFDPRTGFRLDEEDLERVANLVMDGGFTHVVHALAFDESPARDLTELDRRLRKNLHSLFLLAKAMMLTGVEGTLVILTRRAVATTQGEPGVVVENGTLVGLARGIAAESPYLRVRLVDVDRGAPPAAMRDELSATDPGVLAWRGGQRFRETLSEVHQVAPPGAGEYLRPGGTYLITGGTGGIGLEVARAFAATPGVNLVLVSRSGLPPREEWATVAAGDDTRLRARVAILRECLDRGATVEVVRASTTDTEAMAAVLAGIRRRFGRLDGIVHAAGVAIAEPLMFRTIEAFDTVLWPKLHGAFILEALTRDDRPDFIVHFASVAAVLPSAGQGDYAAANAYLDNLARVNANPACRVLAIDWYSWKETGMAVEANAVMDAVFKSLPTVVAMELFDQAMRSTRTRLLAGEINYAGPYTDRLLSSTIALSPEVTEAVQASVAAQERILQQTIGRIRKRIDSVPVELTGRPGGGYTPTELVVAKCLTEAFGYPTLNIHADFLELGGDSITALGIANNLSAYFGVRFDPAMMLTDRSVEAVAHHLDRLGVADAAEPEPVTIG
jgi:acyl transferase domain-containing protein